MILSSHQQNMRDLFLKGYNIFLTGPGGSGKTSIIKVIYDDSVKSKKSIHLTAMTGVAAVQLHDKAKTLHSWAGIGLGDQSIDKYISKINSSKVLTNKWKSIDILIIDEVSMLSEDLFNKLEKIARVIRKNNNPFGSIQIVITGDFYQLPPVKNNAKFCFESPLFNKIFEHKIVLDTIFRQKDNELLKILNNIRLGRITKKNIEVLNKRIIDCDNFIKPVILMPKKSSVDYINNTKLKDLNTEKIMFERKILDNLDTTEEENNYLKMMSMDEYNQELEFLEKYSPVIESLNLKVNCQVMSIINVEEEDKLVISNGTQGVVKKIVNGLPFVEFENGISRVVNFHTWKCQTIPCCGVSQLPLILSWALTIHKAQGCTLTHCRMNIGDDIFEAGQTYVALSRIKSLDGLYLDAFNPQKIRINPKVKEFYKMLT